MEGRKKSHGQGGASVGPAAYYSTEGLEMDDFIAAPLPFLSLSCYQLLLPWIKG